MVLQLLLINMKQNEAIILLLYSNSFDELSRGKGYRSKSKENKTQAYLFARKNNVKAYGDGYVWGQRE